jgi:GNAT superfamily N-acetyltransferase
MNSAIKYRELNTSNEVEIAKVAEIHENAPKNWDPEYKTETEQIHKRIEQLKSLGSCLDRYFLLAETQEGSIIGFHWLDLEETNGSTYGHVKSLWIHDDYQRRGIAKALKKSGELWAKSKGAIYLKTTVHATNQRMIAFNRRQGYEQGFIEMVKKL